MFTAAPVLEQMLHCQSGPLIMNQKPAWKPHVEIAHNCPRCASSNTKFCYYNNYSLSQPRYFCKGCRRYWTKGGSLRNVPVGGGCRKNRRGRSVRLSQTDRMSMSYYRHNSSSSDDLSEQHSKEGANGPDIDLAAVFAKFLNQNSSNEPNPNFVGSESISDDHDVHESNALSDHSQISSNPAEDLLESVELLQGLVLPDHYHQQLHEEDGVQNIMGNQYHHDLSVHEFGLQGLLGDEDVFWSDTTASTMTSSTTSFAWQELDNSFPSDDDDHMKISTTTTNLCSDNWSSFDFSGLEVFSGS